MKKLVLLAVTALMCIPASAQDSDNDYLPDGLFTLEWKFNPFDYEDKPKNMAQFTARMFLNEKSVVRLSVGVGFKRDKDEKEQKLDTRNVDSKNYDISNSNTTTINKETTLKIGAGYEYHFANSGRLDFYAGAEAGYLGRFYSATKETQTDKTSVSTTGTAKTTVTSTYDNFEYKKSNADRNKFNENGFYGTIFTGVDFFVYRKLYIGAELGVTFNMAKKANGTYTENKGEVITTDGKQTANWSDSYASDTGVTLHLDNIAKTYSRTAGNVDENTGNTMKVYFEPTIRIGWMF